MLKREKKWKLLWICNKCDKFIIFVENDCWFDFICNLYVEFFRAVTMPFPSNGLLSELHNQNINTFVSAMFCHEPLCRKSLQKPNDVVHVHNAHWELSFKTVLSLGEKNYSSNGFGSGVVHGVSWRMTHQDFQQRKVFWSQPKKSLSLFKLHEILRDKHTLNSKAKKYRSMQWIKFSINVRFL